MATVPSGIVRFMILFGMFLEGNVEQRVFGFFSAGEQLTAFSSAASSASSLYGESALNPNSKDYKVELWNKIGI